MPQVQAVATLPNNDPKVATAALRGRLRAMVEGDDSDPDWATLRIFGPQPLRDARGVEWFQWVATVELRRASDDQRSSDPPESRPTVFDLGILRRRTG